MAAAAKTTTHEAWRLTDGALKCAATKSIQGQRLPGSMNLNRPLQRQPRRQSQRLPGSMNLNRPLQRQPRRQGQRLTGSMNLNRLLQRQPRRRGQRLTGSMNLNRLLQRQLQLLRAGGTPQAKATTYEACRLTDGALKYAATKSIQGQRLPGSMKLKRPLQVQRQLQS